jgi:hypothetical protein
MVPGQKESGERNVDDAAVVGRHFRRGGRRDTFLQSGRWFLRSRGGFVAAIGGMAKAAGPLDPDRADRGLVDGIPSSMRGFTRDSNPRHLSADLRRVAADYLHIFAFHRCNPFLQGML